MAQSIDTESTKNEKMTQQEVDKLEAVRDLLFGQNVREYRDEFKELKDLLKSHRDEIDKSASAFKSDVLGKIEELDARFNTKLDDAVKQIETKIDKLSTSKTDKKQLANILSDMAKQLDS